ncbi:MAG: sensor histidine kinase [Treponema sp.]|nr:sensor histidine kinase [Treponema sp.]
MKQAVIILTDNAMKNSDRGAEIRVSVGRSGQRAFVRVYNTGQGIPASERKRIFDRFYRSDRSRNRDTGGCGLGLPIAWTIASGHGGKILVESEEGSFAEFTLSIPVAGGRKKR